MEFIKLRNDRYLLKGSNSVIVSEEEKLKLEKRELIIEDIEGCNCQKETTLKIKEIDKKINANKTIKKTKSITK